ncbi:MAG: hypothetical protein JEZ07_14150 [Phycisphaerae bacterium]|nr:hypothetical protein [Phycisphaerae bacterium]
MMKKVLCLLAVLAMASVSLAGTITVTATGNTDGTLDIAYTSDTDVLGLALTVTGVEITGYVAGSTDAFFDVYIDYASGLTGDPTGWVLTGGTPLATIDAAGEATLPAAAVAICVGHLEGITTPETIGMVATLEVAAGDYTIDADTLRGAAVDADGAMTIVGLPVTVTVTDGPDVCKGDVDGDELVTVSDILAIIAHVNTNGGTLGQAPIIPGYEGGDVDGDALITVSDILAVISHVNTNGGTLGQAPCME